MYILLLSVNHKFVELQILHMGHSVSNQRKKTQPSQIWPNFGVNVTYDYFLILGSYGV